MALFRSLVCLFLFTKAKVFSGETIRLEDGSLFSGPIQDGKPHGNGTLTDKHGNNYTGTFDNGGKSGLFIVNYSNHSRFKGMYRDDMKNGKGIYAVPCQYEINKDGDCYVEWIQNEKYEAGLEVLTIQVLEDVEIEFDSLFKINSNYQWKAGPRNDTLNESLGVFYDGEFKNGLYHGHGVYINTNRAYIETYNGEWQNGERSGKGLETYRNLNVSEPWKKYEGEYKNGMKHGEGIEIESDISCHYSYKSFTPGQGYNKLGPVTEKCSNYTEQGYKYEGEFKEDEKYGSGVMTGPHGKNYKGWLVNGTQQGVMTWPDGRKYTGEFNSTKREGQGLMTWPDGRKYQGEWKYDDWFGEGIMIWPDGRKFEGVWKREDLDSYFEDQKKKLKKKLKVGWKYGDFCICMDNDLYESNTYNNDYNEYGKSPISLVSSNLLGKGLMTWPNGSTYDGEWKKKCCAYEWGETEETEEIKHGYGLMIWADGRKYEGEWFKGQMEGNGVMTWPDGRKYEGEWSEDKRHGEGIFTWPNGGSFDGMWQNDEMNGLGKMTMKNGKQCIQNWLSGINKNKPCL